MPDRLHIDAFLARSHGVPMLDVRTPSEFVQGHIPGAHNLPLFSNEERAKIGTLYKQVGREAALLYGLDLVGPKLRRLVERAHALVKGEEVLVHCWRGGMRSESVADLLTVAGYRIETLQGGYKAFRHYALDVLRRPQTVCLLGGMTGSGKTDVLRALTARGEQVIDLEALAHHKGSVFGHLGESDQPSQEHFENELAMQWRTLDPARPVWIEDESRRLGRLLVPAATWAQLQQAEVFVLDVPFEIRVTRLVEDYGQFEATHLIEAIRSIGKRLGGLRTKQAQQAVRNQALADACRLLLAYYDTTYTYNLDKRDRSQQQLISGSNVDTSDTYADRLLATKVPP